jgi:hypothetical protein
MNTAKPRELSLSTILVGDDFNVRSDGCVLESLFDADRAALQCSTKYSDRN